MPDPPIRSMHDWAGEVRSRLSAVRLSPEREAEIVDELAQHLDDHWRELVAGGVSPEEATRTTLAQFRSGNVLARHLAALRQAHATAPITPGFSTGRLLSDFAQDLRYALRVFSRQPGFTAVAVLSLALGIALNTTIFSVAYGVLWRTLPYPDADRLVRLVQTEAGDSLTMAEYEVVKEHARALASVSAYRPGGERRIGPPENQDWVTTVVASTDFLGTLGLRPQIGREFSADETRAGGPSAVLLSDGAWRSLFGADPHVLGRTITVNDVSATVIGVLPAGFWFPQRIDVLLPLKPTGNVGDTGTNTQVLARLGDAGIAPAQAELTGLTEQLREAGKGQLSRRYRGLTALAYGDWLVGDVRDNLLLLFGATGLLLLICCGNLALLLVARFAARARELAVRAALGSSRLRLLAQLLTENLLLTTMGAAAGVAGASALVRMFVSASPFDLPTSEPIRVNAVVLGFVVATTIATALFVTLIPFLSRRVNVPATLRTEGGSGASGAVRARTRNLFIIAEVALSTTLLVPAGLLIETMYRTSQEQLGFVPGHVLTFETPFDPERARNAEDRLTFTRLLLERLERTPGVVAAAATNLLPLTGQSNLPTQKDGQPDRSIGGMEIRAVSERYFDVMGIPVLRGRTFGADEARRDTPVTLVSQRVSDAWWTGGGALNDRVIIGRFQGKTLVEDVPREVIGIVGDTKAVSLQASSRPTVFVPITAPFGSESSVWVVKTDGNRMLGETIRAVVASIDPGQRITRVRMMDDIVTSAAAEPRFNAFLFGTFAAVALALTAVGLYGVLSFLVAQRRQEIGTRMALGASRQGVLRALVRQALSLTAVGLSLGLLSAFIVSRWLSSLLFGVSSDDLTSFAIVAILVLGVGCAAAYIPARRAARIDPLIAMRGE